MSSQGGDTKSRVGTFAKAGRAAFVGRQREMDKLNAALDDALSGSGRLVMLVGDPGIGKTRTAQELAAIAEKRGAQVLWGWCYEERGAPPYWPWVQPIRSCIQQKDADRLASEMGDGAAAIAEIVPEIRHVLPHLKPPPALETEQARFRLFDSITTFIKNAAQAQPLMLALEDLHWADRSSLLLLEFLAREIATAPLLLVGTYRDMEVTRRHPLSQALGNLIREPVFQRVQLRGLSSEDVERFVEITAGTIPSAGLVEAVHTRTEGNPLFVGEIVRLLSKEEIRGEQGLNTRIPEGVRDAIGRRLDRLSDLCNEVLTAASVIGRGSSLNVLGRLFKELSQDQILEMVGEALEVRMIEEIPQAAGQYQFTHALVGETLLEELSLMGRVRMHAHIAEALEDLYGSDTQAHAAELAHHFTQAEAVLGIEKLVRYSLIAGETSLSNYAYEEALAHFERALNAKEDEPVDSETAALLFGLARAQAAAQGNHIQKAFDTLNRAFDCYTELDDIPKALSVAEYPINFPAGLTGLTNLIGSALKLVSPESLDAGRLQSRYIRALGVEQANYGGSIEALAQTLSIAQLKEDKALEMRALAEAADVDMWHLHPRESLEKSLRAIKLSQDVYEPSTEWLARYSASQVLVMTGDLAKAQVQASALLLLSEKLSHGYRLRTSKIMLATILALRGDWDAALSINDQLMRNVTLHPIFLIHRALVEAQLGKSEQADSDLELVRHRLRDISTGQSAPYAWAASMIPYVARITGAAHCFDIAESAVTKILSPPQIVPWFTLLASVGLAQMALQRGDVESAAVEYHLLKAHGSRMFYFVSNDRLLGLLARTADRLDDASEHFEDALIFCHKAGYRPEYAWACYDYADALFDHDARGDHARAVSLLTEALDISTELGMRPLKERVTALQNQTEKHPQRKAPAKRNRHALTYRQLQVLNFITQGMTNNEIAGELVLSERTVQRHIANIYDKINVRNRAEAIVYALNEPGLMDHASSTSR